MYCGSRMGSHPAYRMAAHDLALELVRREIRLVYGGGNVGLMGVVASTVMEAGGQVTGVIPGHLMERELGMEELTELLVVPSMHQRKQEMADRADGFIALPGGMGTFEEMFEILTWFALGIHSKPCGLLNVEGFYDPLLHFLNHVEAEGFMHQPWRDLLLVNGHPGRLLDAMERWQAPEVKTLIEHHHAGPAV